MRHLNQISHYVIWSQDQGTSVHDITRDRFLIYIASVSLLPVGSVKLRGKHEEGWNTV